MTNPDAIPIAFLYTEGRERIEGATRFQKLIFLAQQEGAVEEFKYQPEQFGPYSPELAGVLDSLVAAGLVEKNVWTNEYGKEKHVYSLTVDGIQYAQDLLDNDRSKHLFDMASEIKGKYNDWGLERLLRYVYRTYEDYASETELDTDRLFDPEAESVFAADATETDSEYQYRKRIQNADVTENVNGTWTARDIEYNLTALGETRSDALDNLGEVIAAAEGDAGHEPTDEELEELGVEPDQARDNEVHQIPEFMR